MDHLLPLCLLALAAGPDAGLARVGGVPTFIVGGKPHSGVCYSSYNTHPTRLEARAKAFGEAGCDIFNFVVELAGHGYSAPMWTGPGQVDFTPLDDRVHAVLRGAPNALFLPRIYLDTPPRWRAQNPGEMMILDNGSTSFGQKLFALCARLTG